MGIAENWVFALEVRFGLHNEPDRNLQQIRISFENSCIHKGTNLVLCIRIRYNTVKKKPYYENKNKK